MWINRAISERLHRLMATRPAVVVTGARQVGKTSLLKKLCSTHAALSLDLPAVATQADNDGALFLKTNPPPLFIDEVQYAPGLFRHLKLDIDQHRSEMGRFVLSGSQKFSLMREVSDSLAGRVAVVELEGLSFSELRGTDRELSAEEFLIRGGFPELCATPEVERADFFRSYLATYLERDVRAVLNVGSLRDFERFIRACALRSGQLINRAELARDVGISATTANQWLSVLAASNQIFLLEPWFSNKTRSITKTPKLYWADSGMLAFLVGINSVDDLVSSPLRGALWESLVFAEFRKRHAHSGREGEMFFYRDRSQGVDFLIHRGGRFELYDAKWSENPTNTDAQALHKVGAALGEENVVKKALITRSSAQFQRRDGVSVLPFTEEWEGRSR